MGIGKGLRGEQVVVCLLWTFLFLLTSSGKVVAQANVSTDLSDYAPGSMVQITGSRFVAAEIVQLQVVNLTDPSDSGPEHEPWTVTADGSGAFMATWFVTGDELDATLQLTATGLASGRVAQVSFQDAAPASGGGSMSVSPASVSAGSTGNSLTFTFTQSGNGANGSWGIGSYARVIIPGGWTAPQSADSSSAGYIAITPEGSATASIASISGSGPWTVTVNMTTPNGGGSWNLVYNQITAPAIIGTSTFTTATHEGSGGTPVNISTQPSVAVSAGAAHQLAFTTGPANIVAGQTMASLVVQIQDAYGNSVSANNVPITFTLSSNSFASGTTTVNTDGSGKATFTNLVITKAATGYTISASNPGLATQTSGLFNVSPATANAANSFITASPVSIIANGISTSAIITSEKDAYGNSLTSSGVTPALSTTQGTLGVVTDNHNGTYSATLTSSLAAGTATVTGTINSVAIPGSASVGFTAGSTLSLASSVNPALPGATVIFTATVQPVSPSTGTPSGFVQFLTNGVFAGAVALTNGSASFPISTLPHATNFITAQYAGGGNFIGSTNILNEVINSTPFAGTDYFSRPTNVTLIIKIADLLTNVVEPDGDAVTLAGVSAHSTNGATVMINGNFVIYLPQGGNGNITDDFTYTVRDSFGATNSGLVVITLLGSPLNQAVNIRGLKLQRGIALVQFAGIPTYNYYVQASTNPAPTASWVTIGTVTAATNGLFEFLDTEASNYPARYYRTASTSP